MGRLTGNICGGYKPMGGSLRSKLDLTLASPVTGVSLAAVVALLPGFVVPPAPALRPMPYEHDQGQAASPS
jgi:hypothetical protein